MFLHITGNFLNCYVVYRLLSASWGSDPGNMTVTVVDEETESVLRGCGFLHSRNLTRRANVVFDRMIIIGLRLFGKKLKRKNRHEEFISKISNKLSSPHKVNIINLLLNSPFNQIVLSNINWFCTLAVKSYNIIILIIITVITTVN